MAVSHYYIYILECNNGAYYTGYTSDLARRYQEHLNGTGKCKYTRSFKPLRIARSWLIIDNKSVAMKIERFIKSQSKLQKTQLILHPENLSKHYAGCQSLFL